jgi:hypothetical protein
MPQPKINAFRLMRASNRIASLSAGLVVVCAHAIAAGTNLLPGLMFQDGPEMLPGRLLFVYAKDWPNEGTSTVRANVYSLDLKTKQLRSLVETPPLRGWGFHPAPAGDAFSLEFGYFTPEETNVIVWVENGRFSRLVSLPARLEYQQFAGTHAAFRVSLWDGTNVLRRIIDYDAQNERMRTLELTNASKWEYQEYELPIGTGSTSSGILEFKYVTFGKHLTGGVDYKKGIYSYDVQTGEINWAREAGFGAGLSLDDTRYDGQYMFFADHFPSDCNDRTVGRKLVLSQLSEFNAREVDPKGKQFKVLARFPKEVDLWTLSPCRRYALAKRDELVSRDSGRVTSTYFLVDLVSGKYRVFLRDETARRTKNVMDYVYWVAAP